MIEEAGCGALAVTCDVARTEDVKPRWITRSKHSGAERQAFEVECLLLRVRPDQPLEIARLESVGIARQRGCVAGPYGVVALSQPSEAALSGNVAVSEPFAQRPITL
jgi:hypothetical protein